MGYCACNTVCSCETNCMSHCSHVCTVVGSCGSNLSTPANPKLTVSYWTALKAVLDSWLSNWLYSASPAAVSAGARVLASDWNTKLRDPANQYIATYSGGSITAHPLNVATASVGQSVGASGVTPSDLVAKLNTKKCTTVSASICASVCTCNVYRNCSCVEHCGGDAS